jgi:hypothetical protein
MLHLTLRVADAELVSLAPFARVEVHVVEGLWVLAGVGRGACCHAVHRLALLGRERNTDPDELDRRAELLTDGIVAAVQAQQPVLDVRELTVPWTAADLEVFEDLEDGGADEDEEETGGGPYGYAAGADDYSNN